MEQNCNDALLSRTDWDMGNLRKWLRLLLVVHIVMLSFSVLRNVINFGKLYNWINAALDLAVIFCLLMLRKENRLYTLAAWLMMADLVFCLPDTYFYVTLFRGILGDGYLELVIPMTQVVYYIAMICGLGAVVPLYLAHRSLVKPYDPKMNKYWIYLLIANLAVSVLVSCVGSVLASMIESGTLSVITYQNYIYPLLRVPSIVISVLYMVCLYKTERKFAKI